MTWTDADSTTQADPAAWPTRPDEPTLARASEPSSTVDTFSFCSASTDRAKSRVVNHQSGARNGTVSTRPWTAVSCWAGSQLSSQICKHHRRRLRRIGWESAIDPPVGGWAESAAIHDGNTLEVLVDGAEALPRIAEALRTAESHVHLTGWHFTPGFSLERDGSPTILRNLLAELAERIDVRILVWAGAPLPFFRPSRADMRKIQKQLTEHTRIQCALDARERPMHCHHEKTIVIDDRVAFVGGIDLTSEAGDRYDSSEHPARGTVGWHDACAMIEGPAVKDVADHFQLRWLEVTGETLPPTQSSTPTGTVRLQIVRTVPEKVYERLPRGDFGILETYGRALRSAAETHLPRKPVSLVTGDRGGACRKASPPSPPGLPSAARAAGKAEQWRR